MKFFQDRVEMAVYQAARDVTGDAKAYEALGKIFANKALQQKFVDAFENIMNQSSARKDSIDPERAERIRKAKAAAQA